MVPPLVGGLGAAILHALEDGERMAAESEKTAEAEAEEVALEASGAARMHCDAVRAALLLVLAAAPRDGRAPRWCWLPPEAADALGLTAPGGDGVPGAAPRPELPPPRRAALEALGAAVHAPLAPDWTGPWSIEGVLAAAQRRAPPAPAGRPARVLPLHDASCPAQTMPLPLPSIKAAIARMVMRRFECARLLKTGVSMDS